MDIYQLRKKFEDRHPGTVHLIGLFATDHLHSALRPISQVCEEAAVQLVERLGDGPELTAGLRKLREAKDCFVSQAVEDNVSKGGF